MGLFSLSRLLMCAKYQRLTVEDYIRLGLCDPETCPDCSSGHGHYVKNDKMGNNNLLLNNQCSPPSPHSGSCSSPPTPLEILNNLAGAGGIGEESSCNKCKEELMLNAGDKKQNKVFPQDLLMADKRQSDNKKPRNQINDDSRSNYAKVDTNCSGFINLAFVENVTESASWYQPAISRDLAVKVLADCSIGSFIVRCSQTAPAPGSLALTVRVPKNFEAGGIVHYLIQSTAQGFRIKGFTKVFPSLAALVVHHSVMREHLPCRLVMEEDTSCSPVSTAAEDDSDQDFADMDSDPEFPYLVDRLRKQLSS